MWSRESRIERGKMLQIEAQAQYDLSVMCIKAGKLKAAAHFQQEAALLYERAGNVVIGLLKKETPGFGSM